MGIGMGFTGFTGVTAPGGNKRNKSTTESSSYLTTIQPSSAPTPATPKAPPVESPVPTQTSTAAPKPRVTNRRPVSARRGPVTGGGSLPPDIGPVETPNYDISGLDKPREIGATVQSGEGTFPVRKDEYGRMNYDDRPMLETQDAALKKAWDNEPINVAERKREAELKAKGLPTEIQLQSGIGHGSIIDVVPVDAKTGRMPSYKSISAGLTPSEFESKANRLNQRADEYDAITNATKREPIYNKDGHIVGYHDVSDSEGTRQGFQNLGQREISERAADINALKVNEDIKNDRTRLGLEGRRVGLEGQRVSIERDKQKNENARNTVAFQLQGEYDKAYDTFIKMAENSTETYKTTADLEAAAHEYASRRRRAMAELFDQQEKGKTPTPRAKGGPVVPNRDYLVGENEPEAYTAPGLPPQIVGAQGPEVRQFPAPGNIQPSIAPSGAVPNLAGLSSNPTQLITLIKALLDTYSKSGAASSAGPISNAIR